SAARSCSHRWPRPTWRTSRDQVFQNGEASTTSRGGRGRFAALVEVRHHFFGEQTQAAQHLILWNDFERVEQEIDLIGAGRFPGLDRLDDARGIADRDSLGR